MNFSNNFPLLKLFTMLDVIPLFLHNRNQIILLYSEQNSLLVQIER